MDRNSNISSTNVTSNSFNNDNELFENEMYFSLFVLGLFIIGTHLGKSEPKRPERNQKLEVNIFHYLFYILLYSLLPFLLISLICFAILKQITNQLLKIKYGQLYGGMLDSADAAWAPKDISKPVVNLITVVNIKSKSFAEFLADFRKTIDEKVFKHSDDFLKLTSTRSSMLGYTYLLKKQVKVEDCVGVVDINNESPTISYSLLQEILNDISNRPFPQNNTILWDTLVISKPVDWFDDPEKSKTCYVVLSRFNHIIGDGLSLTHLISHVLTNNKLSVSSYLESLKIKAASSTKIIKTIKDFLTYLYVVIVTPAIYLRENFLRQKDTNMLHGPPLTGENIMVYSSEKSRLLLSMVKKIKSTVHGITFTDVILTGISASLETFFNKKSQEIPQFATTAVTSLIRKPISHDSPILKNQFAIALLDLPIASETDSLVQKLLSVNRQRNVLRKSSKYQVNFLLLTQICGVIPEPILRRLLKLDRITLSFSNVAGMPKITILDNYDVEDAFFSVPLRGKAGLGFSFLTYDGRFQLGMVVDKTILSSRDEAQSLINNTFEKIASLYQEVFDMSSPTKIERDKYQLKYT